MHVISFESEVRNTGYWSISIESWAASRQPEALSVSEEFSKEAGASQKKVTPGHGPSSTPSQAHQRTALVMQKAESWADGCTSHMT